MDENTRIEDAENMIAESFKEPSKSKRKTKSSISEVPEFVVEEKKKAPISAIPQYEEFTVAGRRYRRASSHHNSHGHAAYSKPPILGLGDSMFNLPNELMKRDKDHKYAFIPFIMANETGIDPVIDATSRGFWAISRSQDVELARRFSSVASRVHEEEDIITFKGQIAMKRHIDWEKADMARFDEMQKRNEEMRKLMVMENMSFRSKSPNLTDPSTHQIIDQY